MSTKYAKLTDFLRKQTAGEVTLSFAEIERILGFTLPASARRHGVWWTNSLSPGRHNDAWLSAGWETADRNMRAHTISFQRTGKSVEARPQARKKPSLRRAASAVFDPTSLTETDLAADCTVRLQLRWRRLGEVRFDDARKLHFPAAPTEAGLYRMIVRKGNRTNVYVGEAANLKRRFGNYRRPANSQQTSLRLNALLVETLGAGGAVFVDIAYQQIGLIIDGREVEADLTDKAVRRMIEHAAIVGHGGIDVEMLNR